MDIIDFSFARKLFLPDFITAAAEERWDDIPPWGCFLNENSLPTTSVMPLRYTPTLMIFGELDPLVPSGHQAAAFDALCAAGYQLDHLECTGAEHVEGTIYAVPQLLEWASARLAGEPIPAAELCAWEAPSCCAASPAGVCP